MKLVVIRFRCSSKVNQIECALITFTWHNRKKDLKRIMVSVGVILVSSQAKIFRRVCPFIHPFLLSLSLH